MIFGALPMCRIQLHLVREELERASLALAEAGVLDPEPAEAIEGLDEAPGEDYASAYSTARLKYEKLVRFLGTERRVGRAFERDLPTRRPVECSEEMKQRTLPRSTRTDDCHGLPCFHGQMDVSQDGDRIVVTSAVDFLESSCLEHHATRSGWHPPGAATLPGGPDKW